MCFVLLGNDIAFVFLKDHVTGTFHFISLIGMLRIMLSVAALVGAATAMACEEARLKCAYRIGCGNALQNYMVGCSEVLQGSQPTRCPEICQLSLIALTSTEEGKALMDCECSDAYCEDQKQRPEICRSQVLKTISEPIVSCRVAQWICNADAQCSTALEYYNRNCKAMFHGKKCTPRCHNSINILRRQEKAAKLAMCKCDGLENYDCHAIQRNMNKLCFHKHSHHANETRVASADDIVPTVVMANTSEKLIVSWIVLTIIVTSLIT